MAWEKLNFSLREVPKSRQGNLITVSLLEGRIAFSAGMIDTYNYKPDTCFMVHIDDEQKTMRLLRQHGKDNGDPRMICTAQRGGETPKGNKNLHIRCQKLWQYLVDNFDVNEITTIPEIANDGWVITFKFKEE